MHILSQLLIGLVALIHAYIVWLELFAWVARGPKVFTSLPAELFPATKTLASNQGLYNVLPGGGAVWRGHRGHAHFASADAAGRAGPGGPVASLAQG